MRTATYRRTHGYVGHPELPHGYDPYLPLDPGLRDDWMSTAAVVCGALLLFPFAILLGHLAAHAAHGGSARDRRRAVVGLALGYAVATLTLIAVGAWALLEAADPEALALLAR